MKQYWVEDFVYDTIAGLGTASRTVGLHDWFYGEHVKWNDAFSPVKFTQCIFVAEDDSASTTTYAKVYWRGTIGSTGLPPINMTVTVRISDYYTFKGDQIETNWMMLDLADVMRQAGMRAVPAAADTSPRRGEAPPRALEGVPAPLSAFTPPHLREMSRKL